MDCCFSSFNTKGFTSAIQNNEVPPSSHITYGGCFNQLKFSIGPKATKPLELFIGYARAQNQNSIFDNHINDYLAVFTKGNKDGADRDNRSLNAVLLLDVSGSMGCDLTLSVQACRIQLAKQAILMFFSKLRKTDGFGLIIFNHEAKVLIPLQKVSSIEFETLSSILRPLLPDGSTTLRSGLSKAKEQFNRFMNENNMVKSFGIQNRIVMLTDVDDNSIQLEKQFINQVQQSGIHTTIIGISDAFKSNVCESLVQVKGFNYFCATQLDDLKRYLFNNFDFTFFPSNYDTQITLISNNVRKIQVFGTPDAEKVPSYNIQSQDSFLVTKIKTSFPSQLQLSQNGMVKTYGGLILIKLEVHNKNISTFSGALRLRHKASNGQEREETYNINYQAPLNQQFYSDESLYQALSAFFYSFEVKKILEDGEKDKKVTKQEKRQSLIKLKQIAPSSKHKQIEDLLKTLDKNGLVKNDHNQGPPYRFQW